MKIRHILPVLASAGFIFATYTVINGSQPMPVAAAVVEPASAPFKAFIAGSGIIEAQSQNIAIGTPLSGIVSTVLVSVGEKIKSGAPLFFLDNRESRSALEIKTADLSKALAEVNVAQANLNESLSLNQLAEAITDKRAISGEELLKRRNAVLTAKARLESAKAAVEQAEASLGEVETTLERLVVRAPVDSEVLQVNLRPGEFAQAGTSNTPLLLLGDLDQLHVRVDIDENDAWRFDKNSKAVAYLRGNRDFKFDLQLAYIEPFVVPKKSLTGDSTERVDTRVLQALYSFNQGQRPIYVGQQMDVFIEAQEFATDNGNSNPPQTGG
ncbi:MAG: efflux RND transporter periplasmic adaptor subunit [Methylovulum sp.]|uniref:HlyD family secretion protein n=1 Tax=Methylovulum sp. TaxID=1916980 RepID=UPI0026047EEE|nr:efflux RND transporter periplasmic adaptor subunit [Methylovulum sp.]MDD2725208.1 efflux RND transporter periplasmic adaptor subunit [Methylovulum sp.]MDD5125599.1 efflux RND transporter periplasmic adaptor subunit [Methylovulum sp.]